MRGKTGAVWVTSIQGREGCNCQDKGNPPGNPPGNPQGFDECKGWYGGQVALLQVATAAPESARAGKATLPRHLRRSPPNPCRCLSVSNKKRGRKVGGLVGAHVQTSLRVLALLCAWGCVRLMCVSGSKMCSRRPLACACPPEICIMKV